MGKGSQSRFRSICCMGRSSTDTVGKDVTKDFEQPTSKKGLINPSKAETLSQEIDELDDKLQSLITSFDAIEDKYEATECQILEFFGRCMVEKLERDFFYTVPLLVINNKMKFNHDAEGSISPSVVISDVSEELVGTKLADANTTDAATEMEIYQVPPLTHYCRQMFYCDVKSDGGTGGSRRCYTDLGSRYQNVASQRASKCVQKIGLEMCEILPLRKMCYVMLTFENAEQAVDDKAAELQEAGCNEKLDIQLSGKFGQINPVISGLAQGAKQSKEENLFDTKELAKAIHPLQNTQAVLHQEILIAENFPFRVSLRDIMLRNTFYECQAKFLCINLLMSLQYLHGLNIVHGRITPKNVIFTHFGYPCLIDVEIDKADGDPPEPEPAIEYTSPEQVKDETVTPATDVFLTGILVYSTIYGKSPFKADTFTKTRANILDETFIPEFDTDTISKDGRCFIRKLLKMNPDNRFRLQRCKTSLTKEVKWFSTLNQHELCNQTYPSPFKEFLITDNMPD